MNHVRNIKETLKIPDENRNVATSSCSSWTDSQLFLGSQFWYEISQGTSQDLSLSSKNSQQSAQESCAESDRKLCRTVEHIPSGSSQGIDQNILKNYLSKPLLFGDSDDKIKTSGFLQKFEEGRRKAKERNNSEFLAQELQRIREKLAADTETSAAVVQTVLEKIDKFSSTLENNLRSLQDDISQKFETLVDKIINSQKELMAELEERAQKNSDSTAEFNSHLKHLSALLSEHLTKCNTVRVMESAIQTSPELKQPESSFQQNSQLEVTEVTHASPNPEQQEGEALPENQVLSKRRLSTRSYRRNKKRPLVLPKTRKSTVSDEENQPETHGSKLQTPLRERCNQNKETKKYSHSVVSVTSPNIESRSGAALGRFMTPLNVWSQDSSSPECVTLVEPILEKLTPELNTPMKHFDLWQLFDSDSVF